MSSCTISWPTFVAPSAVVLRARSRVIAHDFGFAANFISADPVLMPVLIWTSSIAHDAAPATVAAPHARCESNGIPRAFASASMSPWIWETSEM